MPGKCQESVTAVELISFTLIEVGIRGQTVSIICKDYLKSCFLVGQMTIKNKTKQNKKPLRNERGIIGTDQQYSTQPVAYTNLTFTAGILPTVFPDQPHSRFLDWQQEY